MIQLESQTEEPRDWTGAHQRAGATFAVGMAHSSFRWTSPPGGSWQQAHCPGLAMLAMCWPWWVLPPTQPPKKGWGLAHRPHLPQAKDDREGLSMPRKAGAPIRSG